MSNLKKQLEDVKSRMAFDAPQLHSVRFVATPEEARPADPNGESALWGMGADTWRIYQAPGETPEDALRAVGIDPDKDQILDWTGRIALAGQAR